MKGLDLNDSLPHGYAFLWRHCLSMPFDDSSQKEKVKKRTIPLPVSHKKEKFVRSIAVRIFV